MNDQLIQKQYLKCQVEIANCSMLWGCGFSNFQVAQGTISEEKLQIASHHHEEPHPNFLPSPREPIAVPSSVLLTD